QLILASSMFINTFFGDRDLDGRIRLVLHLWNNRAVNRARADAIMDILEKYDENREKAIPWTDKDETALRDFNKRRTEGRVAWNRYEFRFFKRGCRSTCLVTGLQFDDDVMNVDRICDEGVYALLEVMLIPRFMNFAKYLIKIFQNRTNVPKGISAMRWGVSVMRKIIDDEIDLVVARLPM
ncbi:hypothetical protein BG003_002635, partial [Podila horticola]